MATGSPLTVTASENHYSPSSVPPAPPPKGEQLGRGAPAIGGRETKLLIVFSPEPEYRGENVFM